jgi:2-methylisocitrate lyase-like PEP mutase family enzyme
MDAPRSESLKQVQERLAAYRDAGADAVGVQLSDSNEFRKIGMNARAPLVSLWPKERMTAYEFLRLGFKIALMPSSASLAALTAVSEMLTELKEKGTERDYFGRITNFAHIAGGIKGSHKMARSSKSDNE